jgi:hypothetical protein
MMADGRPLKLEKIFPLNLTARAAALVAGNPVTTRMESGVSNCFPGLEFDHRNLDRRFFPGLVFEFVPERGARLHLVDLKDPDLDPSTFANRPDQRPNPQTQANLRAALSGNAGASLAEGLWFLDSVTQSGKTISVTNIIRDGMTIWRLVRSLETGPVSVVLERRTQSQGGTIPQPRTIKLDGWRRSFTSSDSGVISDAYLPGEMTQSLCSPWMHDFRDCACTYWASNHPDIVLAEEPPGTDDPVAENTPIDWLRAERSPERTAAALPTERENRAAQMDHYQINKTWQDLSIVLAGHEISRPFNAREPDPANPFESADQLADELTRLAELEHAVTLEYLYALYSVKSPDLARGALADALTFVRHQILKIAVSEMRHLRWANQLIWELEHAQFVSRRFGPALGVAPTVPATPIPRAPSLEALTPDILQSFVDIEKPSGTLNGAYARVLATLRLPQYSGLPMEQLAARILADGTQHYSSFREIQVVLQPFSDPPSYLVPNFKKASPNDAGARKALALYKNILTDLANAYALGDMEDALLIAEARQTMFDLKAAADQLAARGLGVPYF